MNIHTYREIEHAKRAYRYHEESFQFFKSHRNIHSFNQMMEHSSAMRHYDRVLSRHGIVNYSLDAEDQADPYINACWIAKHQDHALKKRAWHRLVDQYWPIPF